jgi:hypothetical protein
VFPLSGSDFFLESLHQLDIVGDVTLEIDGFTGVEHYQAPLLDLRKDNPVIMLLQL